MYACRGFQTHMITWTILSLCQRTRYRGAQTGRVHGLQIVNGRDTMTVTDQHISSLQHHYCDQRVRSSRSCVRHIHCVANVRCSVLCFHKEPPGSIHIAYSSVNHHRIQLLRFPFPFSFPSTHPLLVHTIFSLILHTLRKQLHHAQDPPHSYYQLSHLGS